MSLAPDDPLPSGEEAPSSTSGVSPDRSDASPLAQKPVPIRGITLSGWVIVALIVLYLFMSWKLAFIIGLGLAAIGGWLAKREHDWLKSAQLFPGQVTELISESGGARGGTTYRPRIRYTTPDGAVHGFIPSSGSKPAGFTVGESVVLAYYDAHPEDKRIVTFGSRYGFASFVVVLGLSIALLAATIVLGRTVVPRIYLHGQLPGSF